MRMLIIAGLLLLPGCKVVSSFAVDHHFHYEDTQARAKVQFEHCF